jgi:pimeloyl-ACP methyl ester carboxylesterase
MQMNFIESPLLRIGYREWNPDAKRCIVLVHGWPDSMRCWHHVVPHLVDAGYRVIAPALRGFLPTTFLSESTPRTGQLAALGRDMIDFVHGLNLEQPVLVGHDWGARAVANACGLLPGIASHMVMISVGYGTNDPSQSLSMEQTQLYWYHWFMATERGKRTVRENGKAFAQRMWDTWAPSGWYLPDEFEQTAMAFNTPDWAEVTLHSYQHRWGHAPSDPYYDADEKKLFPAPLLDVPTLMLHGEQDGVSLPATSAQKEQFFKSRYERKLLPGVGHFPQREAPVKVAQAILEFIK